MKWKCEVEYRGKRYELVESDCGCFGCAFLTTKNKCKLPIGFPTCSIDLLAERDSFGRHGFDACMKRSWKVVAK